MVSTTARPPSQRRFGGAAAGGAALGTTNDVGADIGIGRGAGVEAGGGRVSLSCDGDAGWRGGGGTGAAACARCVIACGLGALAGGAGGGMLAPGRRAIDGRGSDDCQLSGTSALVSSEYVFTAITIQYRDRVEPA
jgi:hypothetical protein